LRKQVSDIVWDDARFENQDFHDKLEKSFKENDETLSKLDSDEVSRRYDAFWPAEASKKHPQMSYEEFFLHY
jgi:hypothetical protein